MRGKLWSDLMFSLDDVEVVIVVNGVAGDWWEVGRLLVAPARRLAGGAGWHLLDEDV